MLIWLSAKLCIVISVLLHEGPLPWAGKSKAEQCSALFDNA
jgi:hypothetical protein